MILRTQFLLSPWFVLGALLVGCGDDSSDPVTPYVPPAQDAADTAVTTDSGTDSVVVDTSPSDTSDSSQPEASSETGPDVAVETSDAPADTTTQDGPNTCNPEPQTPEDGVRTVLVTHPFGATGSLCGREVRVLRLDAAGKLALSGQSLDIGDCPERVAFSPDGRLALVLNNNSHDPQAGTQSVVVLRNDSSGKVTQAGELKEFSGTNPTHVAFTPDGKKAYVADYNIEGQGAVHVLTVVPGCSAAYVKKIPLALPQATQVLPGSSFAVVLGGKEPIDTTILDLKTDTVVKEYDLFSDFVDAQTLALSPSGTHVAVPNSSPFSSLADTVSLLSIDSTGSAPVPSLAHSLSGVTEPTGVEFSSEGSKLVVSNFSGNSVTWLKVADGKLSSGGKIDSVGLAGFLGVLKRGPNAGLMLVTSVTNLRILRFTADGLVDEGKFSLGTGNGAITGDIAVEP